MKLLLSVPEKWQDSDTSLFWGDFLLYRLINPFISNNTDGFMESTNFLAERKFCHSWASSAVGGLDCPQMWFSFKQPIIPPVEINSNILFILPPVTLSPHNWSLYQISEPWIYFSVIKTSSVINKWVINPLMKLSESRESVFFTVCWWRKTFGPYPLKKSHTLKNKIWSTAEICDNKLITSNIIIR